MTLVASEMLMFPSASISAMLKSQMMKSYNQSQNDRETVDFGCQINYTIQKTRKQTKNNKTYYN